MYAVVTWGIAAGGNRDQIGEDAVAALGARKTCRIHDDVRVADVAGNVDYLELVRSLREVAEQHEPFFTFAAFQLRRNAPLRSNADYDEECVKDVQETA